MNQNNIQKYVDFYINLTMNILMFLIENQNTFRLVIADPTRKYKDIFPEQSYVNDTVVLDLIEWSLEEASVDKEYPILYTKLAFGEDNPYEVNVAIDAIDISFIYVLTNTTLTHLLSRPFDYQPSKVEPNHPEPPHVESIHIKAEAYAKTNPDGIAHSMSKLTLLKKDK